VQGNGLCLLIVYQVRWSDGNLANLSAPAARSICFGGAQPFLPFGFSGRLCLRSQSCCPFFVTWKTSCERRLLTCQGKISIWIYLWCESIVWTIASHPQTALCLMIRGLHCTTFGKGFLYVAYVKSCWIILGTLNWQLRGWQKGHRTPVQAMFLQSVALYFASWRQRERVIPHKNRDPRGEVGEMCNGKDTWGDTWGDSCLLLVRYRVPCLSS
jgi:hypothetical protein